MILYCTVHTDDKLYSMGSTEFESTVWQYLSKLSTYCDMLVMIKPARVCRHGKYSISIQKYNWPLKDDVFPWIFQTLIW